ncbi:TPA: replication initiation protein [Raoultella ornithinolytica]|nr:replication initiation protein [Raoultella ornithinolytica]HAT1671222.1 replication initiation protein [Raoultella ornithinolytica]
MSELVVFKANELAVSRYDLTEHETKLILCCVAQINPTLDGMDRESRTVVFSSVQYAKMLGISQQNAWGRLNKATSDLFKRSIEIIYPTGAVSKRIFNWVTFAEFNRDNQTLKLVFSEDIIPYLFQLKKFIKYNLEHVKAFENKYSMRIYEWLLKELTQRKTNKANIEISIAEFKFMLVLENNYPEFKKLKQHVLNLVSKDLNTYSNMKLVIEKRGRPADTLIFQVELDKQIDLVTELTKMPAPEPEKTARTPIPAVKTDTGNQLHNGLKKTLSQAAQSKIQLNVFEGKFLRDMQEKYNLNGSFSWLTQKQKSTLENILTRYGNS